ncbi:MAG TPA: transglutaminase-like domain-containing protein, partial [Opitutus sp.]|nr:transglutaminase-like domain-containing protein [Opitutus sp.]
IWTFYLKSGVSRYLPLLGAFERLRFSERQSYQSMREIPVVALREDPVTMIAYQVEGMVSEPVLLDPHFGARFATRGHDPSVADTFMLGLTLAENDRAILAQITARITGGEPLSADEFNRRATEWLSRRDYTLQPRIPAGPGDPLVRWLNSTEGGHCELFAGSLVVLARSAGIPARVVTGFYGGSWNGYSNNFMVRNSDAHAWCEVFDVKTQSWLRIDPTPGGGSQQTDRTEGEEVALARRNDRSWAARLESLRVFWYRHIVNFDQNSQLQTFNAVKQATENSSRQMRAMLDRWGEQIRAWFVTPWSGRRLAGSFSVLAGLTIGVLAAMQAYRYFKYRAWGTRGGRSGDRARREAGRWLGKFGELHAGSVTSTERSDVIRELQRIRFGMRETWGEVAPVLSRAKKTWRQEKREQRRKRQRR